MHALASRSSPNLTAKANALGIFAGFDRPMDGNDTLKLTHSCQFGEAIEIKTDPEMVQLAMRLVDRQTTTYDPSDLEDRFETRLRAMTDAKLKGENVLRLLRPPNRVGRGHNPARR
jgi:hypothetical protein